MGGGSIIALLLKEINFCFFESFSTISSDTRENLLSKVTATATTASSSSSIQTLIVFASNVFRLDEVYV